MRFEDVPTDIWALFVNLLHIHNVQRLEMSCKGARRIITHMLKWCTYNTKWMPVQCISQTHFANLERVDIIDRQLRRSQSSTEIQRAERLRTLSTLPKLRKLSCELISLTISKIDKITLSRLERLTVCHQTIRGDPLFKDTPSRLCYNGEWRQDLLLPKMPMLNHLEVQGSQLALLMPATLTHKQWRHHFDLRASLGQLTTLHNISIRSIHSAYAISRLDKIQSLSFYIHHRTPIDGIMAISSYLNQITTLTDLRLSIEDANLLVNHQFTRISPLKTFFADDTASQSLMTSNNSPALEIYEFAPYKKGIRIEPRLFNAQMAMLTVLDLSGWTRDPGTRAQFTNDVKFLCLRKLRVDRLSASWLDRPHEQFPALRSLDAPITISTMRLLVSLHELDRLVLDPSSIDVLDVGETYKQRNRFIKDQKTWPVIHHVKILTAVGFDNNVINLLLDHGAFKKTTELTLQSCGSIGHVSDVQFILLNMPNVQRIFATILSNTPYDIAALYSTFVHHQHLSLLAFNDNQLPYPTKNWTKRGKNSLIARASERTLVWSRNSQIRLQQDIPTMFATGASYKGIRRLLGSNKWRYLPLPNFNADPTVHPMEILHKNDNKTWVWPPNVK